VKKKKKSIWLEISIDYKDHFAFVETLSPPVPVSAGLGHSPPLQCTPNSSTILTSQTFIDFL